MTVDPTFSVYLSTFLFAIGLLIVIVKKNAVFVLMGIELMLNAANLNLVVFSASNPEGHGELMGVFVVVLAAAETGIALAILLLIFKQLKTIDLTELRKLKY